MYLAEENDRYCGAAVVEEYGPGHYYLDKIVVGPEWKGNGVGTALWNMVAADAPELLWRATHENRSNIFYQKACDGMLETDNWLIYWIGMDADISYALKKKKTLDCKQIPSE